MQINQEDTTVQAGITNPLNPNNNALTNLVQDIKEGDQAEQQLKNNLLEADVIADIRAMNAVDTEVEEKRRKGFEAMKVFKQKLERMLSDRVSRITLLRKHIQQAFQAYRTNINEDNKVILACIHVDNTGTRDSDKIIHERDVYELLVKGLNKKRANAAEVFTVSTGRNSIHTVLNQSEVTFLDETLGDAARTLHGNEAAKVEQAAQIIMEAKKSFFDRLATRAGGTNIQQLHYNFEGGYTRQTPAEA